MDHDARNANARRQRALGADLYEVFGGVSACACLGAGGGGCGFSAAVAVGYLLPLPYRWGFAFPALGEKAFLIQEW